MSQKITRSDAPALDDLAEMLNATSAARHRWECDGAFDLEVLRVDEIYDVAELPTYGGDEPQDTMGIYSWDETRLLYCDGPNDAPWVISPRQ